MIERKHITKEVHVGNKKIGGNSPITVQSMLSLPSGKIRENVEQAKRLEAAGCDIIRVAIPNQEAIKLISELKKAVTCPVVADIHYDYRLALGAVDEGVDKIRINPGNIGEESRVKAVAMACRLKGIPIRIGVNSGSVEKEILAKFGGPTPEALVESALYHVSLLEKYDFTDIIVAMKSSSVAGMIAAYEKFSKQSNYPLHLGVTEAGTTHMGTVKSAIGIGSLLAHGIGDTIRVSLTSDPVEEVRVGIDILKALELRRGVNLISCPTCGRTQIDLITLAKQAEIRLKSCKRNITVAVMGCSVNGPGEAREADIGIAGGAGCGLIFRKGEILRKVPEDKLLDELMLEIEKDDVVG